MLSTPQPIPPPDKGTQPRPVTVSDFVSWEAVSWYIAMLMGVWGVFIGIGDYEIATSLFVFVSLIAWVKLGHATRITEPDRNTLFFILGTVLIFLACAEISAWEHGRLDQTNKDKQRTTENERQIDSIPGLHKQIQNLQNGLDESKHQRELETAVLAAKLDAAYKINDLLKDLAPSLMRQSEVNADLIKKQYDRTVLTNRDLKTRAEKVIAIMRSMAKQNAQWMDDARKKDQQRNASFDATGKTPEQIRREHARLNELAINEERAIFDTTKRNYDEFVAQEAKIVKAMLLEKLGGDVRVGPFDFQNRVGSDVIDDMSIAGADPLGSAAGYLDGLVKRLSP